MINWIEKGILVNFFRDTLITSFATSSARISQFDARDVILLQFKVFDRYIKETTEASYFTKVTSHPSFTRLRFIGRINRIH